LAERLWSRSDYTTISPGELTDHLAALALRADVRPRILERTGALLHAGLDILEGWFRATGGFTWRRPDAGAICFARYALPIDSALLAERLRTEYGVLVVPGAHFDRDRFLRIGFGAPATLEPALERVAAALGALGAGA